MEPRRVRDLDSAPPNPLFAYELVRASGVSGEPSLTGRVPQAAASPPRAAGGVVAGALLGHVSAEMSLRYGRLLDAPVRAEYERALSQAKEACATDSRYLPTNPTAFSTASDKSFAQYIRVGVVAGGGSSPRRVNAIDDTLYFVHGDAWVVASGCTPSGRPLAGRAGPASRSYPKRGECVRGGGAPAVPAHAGASGQGRRFRSRHHAS